MLLLVSIARTRQKLSFTLNSAIVLYIFAYYSDKLKMRAPFIYAGLICLVIGYGINISNAGSGVKYFGTFWIVVGSYSAFPGVVSWCVVPLIRRFHC